MGSISNLFIAAIPSCPASVAASITPALVVFLSIAFEKLSNSLPALVDLLLAILPSSLATAISLPTPIAACGRATVPALRAVPLSSS